jgi:hypothetical protein
MRGITAESDLPLPRTADNTHRLSADPRLQKSSLLPPTDALQVGRKIIKSFRVVPMGPESPMDLYWSFHGEVACATHAPTADDPRWMMEGWAPMTVADVRRLRYEYQCQHCAPDRRAIRRFPK